MTLDELLAYLLKVQKIRAYPPWAVPKKQEGWTIVISDSEYAPGGFSVTSSDPHDIFMNALTSALEAAGFDVQRQHWRGRMEVWPRRIAGDL